MRYADVILPLPLADSFTYALPPEMASQVRVGSRLIVPFGTKKFYTAIVVALHDNEPSYTTKEATELLDATPVVLPQQLSLWRWIADYYLCTLGEVYKAALPSGMKLESETSVVLLDSFADESSLSPNEQRVVEALAQKKELSLASLQKETGIRSILPLVRGLLDKGALQMKEEVRRNYKARTIPCVTISLEYFDESHLQQAQMQLVRTPRQLVLLSRYAELSGLTAAVKMQNRAVLREVTRQELLGEDFSPALLKALVQRGILQSYLKEVGRLSTEPMPDGLFMHPLSEAQQKAMNAINEQWKQRPICLLHGVTGSGKTEVYIHLIQQALDRGEQTLFLLPEIVLTAQLTERLRRVFGNRLGVYHSRYSDAERVEVYQKMLSDEPYDIIVGVRSSVFLPFRKLGLLIIDEEHETSFKQAEPAPRYHGRNVALVLAQQMKARTLLGTATPSMETYYNAQQGKYGLVTLSTRFSDVALPRIEVVDMLEVKRKKLNEGPFSPRLLEEIDRTLDAGRQAILFLNRRGYAPVMECHVCGWVPRCQKCDVSLTLHRTAGLMACHYCGTNYAIPPRCPQCENDDLRGVGYGTERIEQLLQSRFPKARIARMDLDTTRSKTGYETILSDFQHGRTDILVGTQMVVKGLDFERVAMVGIINASTMLSQPDFRSAERAFQMMEQVAGRAGRKDQQGTVILQTMDVQSPVIEQVVQHNYVQMFSQQLADRQNFHYPPFCHIVHVYVKHRDERLLEELTANLGALLRQVFGQRVLGPDTPPVSRVQLLYIRQLLVKVELTASLAEARKRLRAIQQHILSQPKYRSAQVYYDVD